VFCRCKEKKAAVVEPIRTVLDSLVDMQVISYADIAEDIVAALGGKNPPQVKEEVMKWLTRTFPKLKKAKYVFCVCDGNR
jgi:hypothetical protein